MVRAMRHFPRRSIVLPRSRCGTDPRPQSSRPALSETGQRSNGSQMDLARSLDAASARRRRCICDALHLWNVIGCHRTSRHHAEPLLPYGVLSHEECNRPDNIARPSSEGTGSGHSATRNRGVETVCMGRRLRPLLAPTAKSPIAGGLGITCAHFPAIDHPEGGPFSQGPDRHRGVHS